ncbi:MAG: DUF4041 domain-containing protein [Oscillospiraceae bacterium]|jgi:hypothetical protein|nr:DUF4041 domain-containing protein [Oscillospiraceae bacterium]
MSRSQSANLAQREQVQAIASNQVSAIEYFHIREFLEQQRRTNDPKPHTCSKCGKSGRFLKLYNGTLCQDCYDIALMDYQRKISEIVDEIKPNIIADMEQTKSIEKRRDDLNLEFQRQQAELAKVQKSLDEGKQVAKTLAGDIVKLRDEAIELCDQLEMESVALYAPKYKFTKSDEYKARLDMVRAVQHQMIRDKTAVTEVKDWTVNNSKAEGKKLVSDMSKLCLRSFNNECESAVSAVRFSNFDRCVERIHKAADAIEKLGRIMQIKITDQYIRSKIEELTLAYEYAQMKEKEKEELRELREQQREAARVAKEIEEARKEAEKEKTHYLQACRSFKRSWSVAPTRSNVKTSLKSRPNLTRGFPISKFV